MRAVIAALSAAVLSACATSAGYRDIVQSWVGAQEVELVRRFGPPASSYESGGSRFLLYVSSRSVDVAGTSPTYSYSPTTKMATPIGGSPGYSLAMRCETTFEVSAGRIIGWSSRGNDCRAM